MSQHTRLSWNLEPLDDFVNQFDQANRVVDIVCRGVDPNDGVAAGITQSIQNRSRDSDRVISRMIRLQANRQPLRQSQCISKSRDDTTLAGNQDQVLIPHQLADRSRHFWGNAPCYLAQLLGVSVVVQQPFPEFTHRQIVDRFECDGIVRIADQPRDFVLFVRNQGMIEKSLQRDIGQSEPGGHPFFVTTR